MRREGLLPASFALEVVAQVARAMAAAESQGLVHRDLKPANLMLLTGPDLTVKVIDFGLAAVKTLIHRLRRRHTQLLREEITQTVLNPDDVEAETRELCEALVQAEGWVQA